MFTVHSQEQLEDNGAYGMCPHGKKVCCIDCGFGFENLYMCAHGKEIHEECSACEVLGGFTVPEPLSKKVCAQTICNWLTEEFTVTEIMEGLSSAFRSESSRLIQRYYSGAGDMDDAKLSVTYDLLGQKLVRLLK